MLYDSFVSTDTLEALISIKIEADVDFSNMSLY